MKKKLFENIGDNMFKLRENSDDTDQIKARVDLDPYNLDPNDKESEESPEVIVRFRGGRPSEYGPNGPEAHYPVEIVSVKTTKGNIEILHKLPAKELEKLENLIYNLPYEPDADVPDDYSKPTHPYRYIN